MNVLIVEDNAASRKVMRITFEHYGCNVIEAEDGQEGIEQAARHRPDVIVSDGLMPRMDGFQLLRALKNDPVLKAIPFVFYSSTYTGDKETELALSLGAEAYVVKPVEPEALWQKTCEVMKEWESRLGVDPRPAIDGSDEEYLREYSRIVATKLEEKVFELEEALALRKQAEYDLKEQEQELATIFENAPFMMLLLDGERKIRRVNGVACSFAGSPATDMSGLRGGEALHCVHALDSAEGCGFGAYCQSCVIRQTVQDTFESGQKYHQVEATLTLSIQGKEQEIQFLISTTKVMVAHKAMILLTLQDISEYKKLEAELLHAQKMESVGTLAGGIAHDFNNILTVINGYGQITLMGMNAEDPHRQNLESLLEAVQRAASLARDLLIFSRKEVGNKKNADLNQIVQSVEKFLRRVIREDIVCSIALGDGKMPIFADELQMEQVLMNLAANARDAMGNGGSLAISTERMELDDKSIAAHGLANPGTYAVLKVADTGTGMDEETCRQIFDPFFTTKESGMGTGLGLAVAYGIIKQHNGHISVSSEPGHGTTFRIYLPLIDSLVYEKGNKAIYKKPDRGGETILLAEDDETIRNMVVSLLESFGYNVIIAVDGEEAVRKFRENRDRIALLLFDLIMPNMNGMAAYDQIKEIAPSIKVIFASGYSNEAIHQKAQEDDNVATISKPYLPSNMLATIRSVLDRGC